MRLSPARTTAAVTALIGVALALVQLRTGIVPMLDTVTYWSGANAVADGHGLTTTLAPSFSNFSAVEFLERGGRLPFLDFPIGYPLVAGALGALIGVGHAMGLLAVAAAGCTTAMVVLGPRTVQRLGPLAVRSLVALAIVAIPTYRLVTQATLSEPIFCALVLAYVVALVRHRDGRCPWWIVVALGCSLGLFRFIGAPLAALAGLEHLRRHRAWGRAIGWTTAMMLPAVANIVWAAASGGGHNAGWRGLQDTDVRIFVRSIGGWFDTWHGDLRLTYFAGAGASWWVWPIAAAWIVLLVAALVSLVVGVLRPSDTRRRLPDSAEMPLAAAAIVTAGLVLGMLGFDALVLADNRLMLPAGVLTICAAVWSVTDRLETSETPWAASLVAAGVVVLWSLVAVRPWQVGEVFGGITDEAPYVRAARASGAAIIVVNDADGVHWFTGIPAVYAPQPTKSLTGEVVDMVAAYRSLPCPMLEANGVLIRIDGSLLGPGETGELDALVAGGRLVAEPFEGGLVYSPTESACS